MSQYAIRDPRRRGRARHWSGGSSAPLAGGSGAKPSGEMSLATPIALPLVAKAAEPVNVREGAPETLFAGESLDTRQRFTDLVLGVDTALAEKLRTDAAAQDIPLPDYVAALAWRALKGTDAA